MKVLVVTSVYPPLFAGGGTVSAKRLVDQLSKLPGVEVCVLTVADQAAVENQEGVEVHRLAPRNIYWSYRSKSQARFKRFVWHLIESANPRMSRVARYIDEQIQPDIVHFRNIEDFSPSIFYCLSKLNVPSIQTLNSYTMIEPAGTLYRRSRLGELSLRLFQRLFIPKRIFSRYVSAVVSVSQFTLNEHLKRGYYRGVMRFVVQTKLPMDRHTRCLAPSGEQVTVGYLGAVTPIKGVAELISSFRAIETTQACRLLVGGGASNEYGEKCMRLANGDPRIEFVGHVNPEAFFSQIDLLVIPSLWHEPFPRVLVEAKAHLVPALVSSSGGTKEGVEHGVTGYIYSNPDQLRSQLKSILSDPEQLLQIQQNIRAELTGCSGNEALEYLEIYRHVMQHERPSDLA